jgi:hypothetical protein
MPELLEAAELLDAPLVWSADMDAIRYHLATLLRAIHENRDPEKPANDLAEALLDDFSNDLTVN